jgi:hypothetical protein
MQAAAERAAPRTACYRRRRPERTLLYRTVQTHFETWLARSRDEQDGASPPAHVEREFRRYPRMRHPCPRLRPCPLRGVWARLPDRLLVQGARCLSRLQRAAHGRDAAHLADHVFPRLPVRQWVLSIPKRLRYVHRLHRRCAHSRGTSSRTSANLSIRPGFPSLVAHRCGRRPIPQRLATIATGSLGPAPTGLRIRPAHRLVGRCPNEPPWLVAGLLVPWHVVLPGRALLAARCTQGHPPCNGVGQGAAHTAENRRLTSAIKLPILQSTESQNRH